MTEHDAYRTGQVPKIGGSKGEYTVGRGPSGLGGYDNFRSLSIAEQREIFFGKPVREPLQRAEDGFDTENRVRPYEWIGKNTRINQILIRRITAADDFILRLLLPLRPLPTGGRITVSELQFNDHLLDDIPEQGVPRLTTQSFRTWDTTLKRKGLAFMMEGGFLMTPMGLQHYAASIMQISNATTDTMILDAYYNLLMVSSGTDDYFKAFGIVSNNPSRTDVISYETRLWSILSKTQYGFWGMVKMGRDTFGARRIRADSMILPYNSRGYLKYNRPETREFWRMGQAGPDNFLGRGYIQSFEDLEIFESSVFPMPDTDQPEDPLVRFRTIGEFADSLHDDTCRDVDALDYKSSMRNRIIHCNRSDDFAEINLTDMIYYSGLFEHSTGEDGDDNSEEPMSRDIGEPFFGGAFQTVGEYLAKVRRLDQVAKAIEKRRAHHEQKNDNPMFIEEWNRWVDRANNAGADAAGGSRGGGGGGGGGSGGGGGGATYGSGPSGTSGGQDAGSGNASGMATPRGAIDRSSGTATPIRAFAQDLQATTPAAQASRRSGTGPIIEQDDTDELIRSFNERVAATRAAQSQLSSGQATPMPQTTAPISTDAAPAVNPYGPGLTEEAKAGEAVAAGVVPPMQGGRDQFGLPRSLPRRGQKQHHHVRMSGEREEIDTEGHRRHKAPKTSFWTYTTPDVTDIKDPQALSMEKMSATGKTHSDIFRSFVSSSENPAERRFTPLQIRALARSLETLYGNSAGYVGVKQTEWVQALRLWFGSEQHQTELYADINDDNLVGEFLHLLYHESATRKRYTGATFRAMATNRAIKGTMSTLPPSAASKKGGAPPFDENALKQRMAQLRNIHGRMNSLIVDFLPGAYNMLVRSQGVDEANTKIKVLENLSRFVVDAASETRSPSMVTRAPKSESDMSANEMILTALQNISSVEGLDRVVQFWTVFGAILSDPYRSEDARKRIAEQMIDRVVPQDMDSTATNRQVAQLLADGRTQNITGVEGVKRVLFTTKINGAFFRFLCEHDLPLPVDFLLVRPTMVYQMGSTIMMKRGEETGACFFGEPDFEFTNDGHRKVLFGFFTCYAGARVLKALNVHILHNVVCKAYVAGGGVTFFDPLDQGDRDSFSSGRYNEKDMFVIPIYPGDKINGSHFDLCGQYLDDLEGESTNIIRGQPHYTTYGIMQRVWNWHARENYFDIEYFNTNPNDFNTLVFRMHQFMPGIRHQQVEKRAYYKSGQGHWGPCVYPGVREDRVGAGRHGYVREVDWTRSGCMSLS